MVAPRVGAWIETWGGLSETQTQEVAPRVGAWIETHRSPNISNSHSSPPAWGRGLKHRYCEADREDR